MSTQNTDTAEGQAAPAGEGGSSPGAMIREARTRLRMSVEDLAAATKLARHTLEALEKDDFNALQEAVYVRGYYRKCAKILGINEARMVDLYNNRVIPKRPDPPAKLRLASGTEIGEPSALPVPMALISAIVAVVVAVLIYNLFKSPDTPHPATPVEEPVDVQPPPSTPAPSEPIPLEPSPAGAAAGQGDVAPGTAPAAAPLTTTPAPAGTTPSPAAPAPQAAAPAASVPAAATGARGTLTLRFSNTSWARVEDATGRILVNGLMREGESQNLSGQPPFSVFLGNGPGVRLDLDGRPVDFSSHVSDNLTARFKVPEGSR